MAFTITKVEDSDYTDQDGNTSPGVIITTKEEYDVEGTNEKFNRFHTTRMAIVEQLRKEDVRRDLLDGNEIGPVRIEDAKSKKGRTYKTLVDA